MSAVRCGDLGFSERERAENVRHTAHLAAIIADAGTVSLVALVSPYRADRGRARAIHEQAGLPFIEAFVDTDVTECARRDPKGLYAQARSGELTNCGEDVPEIEEIASLASLVERP